MKEPWRLRVLYAVCGAAYGFVYHVFGLRRAVVRGNLARSFPGLERRERSAIEREFLRRQTEVLAEVLYGASLGAEELRARVSIEGGEALAAAAPPRPLILTGAHHGNGEWMLQRLSLELGEGLLALYKPIRTAPVDAWLRRQRTRFGARLVPAKSVLAELARFRTARALGLVADQAPTTSPEKHWCEFLGQRTAFYMGPELLGRALRSQVLLVRMERLGRGRYRIAFEPLNEAGERLATGVVTERYARALERWIREDPPGWWWTHNRWKPVRERGSGRAAARPGGG